METHGLNDVMEFTGSRGVVSKMVYKYKRKTNQAQWSEDSMMLAIADCNSGIPVKTTAKKYDLPYATLYRHWKKGSSTVQLGSFHNIFNDEQEGDLRTYLHEMDSVFYGLTREDFKALVFEYAERDNVTYPPSWDFVISALISLKLC